MEDGKGKLEEEIKAKERANNLPSFISSQVEARVIAKTKDCKGCAYNWGSFNTQPGDGYCYMFNEFMSGCKKYTTNL